MPVIGMIGIGVIIFVAEPFFNFDVHLIGANYTPVVVYTWLAVYVLGVGYACMVYTVLRLSRGTSSYTIADCGMQSLLWFIFTIKHQYFSGTDVEARWSNTVESAFADTE
ncbi:MAG: hypothetical protein LR017_01345 [Candidatus Pacebacteria bacterium]|nr:hypothetical protein [Candidatus Paceibacterota bacterium]